MQDPNHNLGSNNEQGRKTEITVPALNNPVLYHFEFSEQLLVVEHLFFAQFLQVPESKNRVLGLFDLGFRQYVI